MNATRLRQVRRLFCHPDAPKSVARHNCRAWVRSVRELGPKWRFIDRVQRQEAA